MIDEKLALFHLISLIGSTERRACALLRLNCEAEMHESGLAIVEPTNEPKLSKTKDNRKQNVSVVVGSHDDDDDPFTRPCFASD
jgi:hypothetical protein